MVCVVRLAWGSSKPLTFYNYKPVQQRRRQVIRAYYSNLYTCDLDFLSLNMKSKTYFGCKRKVNFFPPVAAVNIIFAYLPSVLQNMMTVYTISQFRRDIFKLIGD